MECTPEERWPAGEMLEVLGKKSSIKFSTHYTGLLELHHTKNLKHTLSLVSAWYMGKKQDTHSTMLPHGAQARPRTETGLCLHARTCVSSLLYLCQ